MLCPPHRVLVEAVLPFPPALAEVTLGIGRGRRVILRSYQEEEAGEGTDGAWGREQRRGGAGREQRRAGGAEPGFLLSLPPPRQHCQSHGDGDEHRRGGFPAVAGPGRGSHHFLPQGIPGEVPATRSPPCPPLLPALPPCSASPFPGAPELCRVRQLVPQHSLRCPGQVRPSLGIGRGALWGARSQRALTTPGPVTCPGQPSLPSRTLCWTATLSWPHSWSRTRTPRPCVPKRSSSGQSPGFRLTGESSAHPGWSLPLLASAPPTLCTPHPHFLSSPSPAGSAPLVSCTQRSPHPGKCPQGRAGFLLWLRPPPKPRREKGCWEAGGCLGWGKQVAERAGGLGRMGPA